MRKIIVLFFIFICFSASDFHKFYVSIYQINYNQKNKRIELTSRIFVDDLNSMLFLKYNKKTHISEKEESVEDIELMNKYLSENISIKVNGIKKPINYISNETEANVLICYYKVNEIPKIKTLEIKNTSLFDLNSEQQNIIQTTIYTKKQSLLLTANNQKETITIN